MTEPPGPNPPLPPDVVSRLLAAASEGVGRFSLGLRSEDDFSDAIQEVIIRALPFVKEHLDASEDQRRYVFGVARNLQADRVKAFAAGRDTTRLERMVDLIRRALDDEGTPEAQPYLTTVLLRTIRNRLPSIHIQILNDRVCRGKTFSQIAESTRIPSSTVQRRFKEAVEVLRLELILQSRTDPALREILSRAGAE